MTRQLEKPAEAAPRPTPATGHDEPQAARPHRPQPTHQQHHQKHQHHHRGPLRLALHRINAFLYSKQTGLLLILAMAFFTLMGTLLQQSPDGVRDDPQAYAQWLDSVRPRYGGWTSVLAAVGFFEVFSSWFFTLTSVLLAASIVACTLHRAPQLWQRAMRPHVHAGDGFFAHAGLRAELVVPGSPEQARERVEALLRSHKYRVVSDPHDSGSAYADRFRFAPFGTVVAHAAFVVILLGVLVTSQLGFRLQEFPVTIGSRSAVGQDTGLTVAARSFSDSYYPDGRPADYVSDLVLYRDGQQVAQQEVRVNTPLRYDGVTFYQSYFGVAAVVRVTDSAGAVLYDGGVPMAYTTDDGRHVFGSIALPGKDMKLFVISAASGRTDAEVAPGTVQVDAVPLGQEDRVDTQVIDQGATASVAGYTVAFERERQFTGLSVARDPGSTIVWIGSGLMTLGLFVTMFVKHRRMWLRVRPLRPGDEGYEQGYEGSEQGGSADEQPRSRVQLASADRHDTGFEGQFRRLINDFPRAFSDLAQPDDRAASTSTTQSKAGRR